MRTVDAISKKMTGVKEVQSLQSQLSSKQNIFKVFPHLPKKKDK
jgi:hypothetical protein